MTSTAKPPTTTARPPDPDAPAPRAGRGLARTGTVLAWLGLGCFLVSIVLFLLPVQNVAPVTGANGRLHDGSRVLQDCGAPLAYLLDGRVAKGFGPDGPEHLTAREAAYANRHSCQDRVVARFVPAAILLVTFLVLIVIGLAFTIAGHLRARRAAADLDTGPSPGHDATRLDASQPRPAAAQAAPGDEATPGGSF